MGRGISFAWGLAAAVWLTAGRAQAQYAPAPNPDAVRLYQDGMAAFRAGQFAQAVTKFKAADILSPSPSLSYDIAECYEKLADLRDARHYYEEYLRRAPRAEDRAKVEAELASIDAQILEAAKKAEVTSSAPLVVTEEVGTPQPPNRIPSYILMGLGIAGIAVGIGLDAASNGSANSLVNAPAPQGSKAQGLYDTANSMWYGSIVGYAVGGAVLATGAVIFLVQSVGHSNPAPTEEIAQ